ncbi:hypothetical protein OWR29_03265 [Actinoplanes sp. Pm04-4]|uniref:Nucleoside phosphorylase domain-containing protein n=1 Tax=Paractinoplanes pyxinae TaxID=2997416 RepID=A0ABT4ARZ0_9ACTN|nr:hypothetical protein [Actinoplanes pyxinae]MCY1137002.1 hypothetical protein [Actinoplanes pyxinae]
MGGVDVLIIAALKEELDAVRAASGVTWTPYEGNLPFLHADYPCRDGRRLSLALARPTRMGGRTTGQFATHLAGELKPGCLAMSGVCAGNPSDVALGDVVVAEIAYEYDEGKVTAEGLVGDHRQFRLDERWFRAAQEFDPAGLPSYGEATEQEAAVWFLERLHAGQDPRRHPARDRYFPAGTWNPRIAGLEDRGLVAWGDPGWELTAAGRSHVTRLLYNDVDGPDKLPFAVVAGPMASGSYVAKDGESWDRLAAMGVRTVVGLEMEAATIATVAAGQNVPHWLVVKGVMDHADPNKDDRYKRFAARAAAEVLLALLDQLAGRGPSSGPAAVVPPTSKYRVTVTGSKGVQIGDGTTQNNTFT